MEELISKYTYSGYPRRRELQAQIMDFPRLEDAINELNTNYPRPDLRVCIDGPMDMQNDQYDHIPCGDLPGVYVVFDNFGRLLYIGKAPGNLDGRLIKYERIQINDGGKGFHFKEDKFIKAGSRYLVVIPLPVSRAFEGASIEEYIIRKLTPPLNEEFKR